MIVEVWYCLCQTEKQSVLNTSKKKRKVCLIFTILYPSGTSRGLITSNGNIILKLKRKSAQPSCKMLSMTNKGNHCRLCNSKTRQTSFLWCWIWLRESNIAIFYDVQYVSKRLTLPSCMNLRLIQRQTQRRKLCHHVWCSEYETDKHCRLVLCWIRPRGELRWKSVKRWWEGCPCVCSKHKWRPKGGGGSRWAFVQIPAVRWVHVRLVGFFSGGLLSPYPAEYIRRKNWLIFYPDKNPIFFSPSLSLGQFHRGFPVRVMIRL